MERFLKYTYTGDIVTADISISIHSRVTTCSLKIIRQRIFRKKTIEILAFLHTKKCLIRGKTDVVLIFHRNAIRILTTWRQIRPGVDKTSAHSDYGTSPFWTLGIILLFPLYLQSCTVSEVSRTWQHLTLQHSLPSYSYRRNYRETSFQHFGNTRYMESSLVRVYINSVFITLSKSGKYCSNACGLQTSVNIFIVYRNRKSESRYMTENFGLDGRNNRNRNPNFLLIIFRFYRRSFRLLQPTLVPSVNTSLIVNLHSRVRNIITVADKLGVIVNPVLSSEEYFIKLTREISLTSNK
jgi:hypothetical protein